MVALKTKRYKAPPLGRIGRPTSGWTWGVGVDLLIFDNHTGKHFLLKCEPKDVSIQSTHGPYPPLGGKPGLHWKAHGGRVSIYPGATIDRSSANDDTPAATPIEARMVPSLNYKRELFQGADPAAASSGASGVIELLDPDNELSELLNPDKYVWDQAPITIYSGLKTQRFEDWEVVGRFTASEILGNLNYKIIVLRSVAWQLEGPIHDNYYAGTGDLEGDERLTGAWKPYTVGWAKNVPPTLIDSDRGIHQWSFTASQECMAFKHGGTPLDFFQDYATYAELVAAIDNGDIPSGEYATCLAKSCAAANITISKGIRVDVKGDSNTVYGSTTPTRRADIVRRVATGYGKSRLNAFSQIDQTNFNSFNLRHEAVCGFHWSTVVTKAQALREVLEGVLGYYHIRPATGQLAIGYARRTNTGSIANIAIGDEGMGAPQLIARLIPRAGTRIGYQKNYGPQDRNDLTGAILDDPEAAEILRQDSRWAVETTPYIKTRYPTSVIVSINGGFWNAADALEEAARQQALLKVVRSLYQWTMVIDPNIDLLDRILTFTDGENVLDIGAAKPLLCSGIDSRGTSQITTSWWG